MRRAAGPTRPGRISTVCPGSVSAELCRLRMPVGRVALLFREGVADLLRRLAQLRHEALDSHLEGDSLLGKSNHHRAEYGLLQEHRYGHGDLVRDSPRMNRTRITPCARLFENLVELGTVVRELVGFVVRAT